MAVTTYYTLKISSTVALPYAPASSVAREWTALFGPEPRTAGRDWPDGFLRPPVRPQVRTLSNGYAFPLGGAWAVHEWTVATEPSANGAQTKLTFEAEVEFKAQGGIDDHRESQHQAAAWFFDYHAQPWHKTLRDRLAVWNLKHSGHLIEPAGFREWEFYCGNGGGGGE